VGQRVVTVDELLGIEKSVPKLLQKNVEVHLPDGRTAVTHFFSGLRSKVGRTIYLTTLAGRFMGTRAVLKPKLRGKYGTVYLYTLRSGQVVALPPSTQRKLIQRVKRMKQRLERAGIRLVVV